MTAYCDIGSLFIKLLLYNYVYGWGQLMPGGLKLNIDGQFYSFTSDLCSGGIFFKQPVKLGSICIHGYFFRRPNGCLMSDSDIIAGQNYVCTNYDANTSSKVQAFIPVTAPELPLEHSIAFFEDENTLKNFRRYVYVKALQRTFYEEKETGASGIVISNTHNTPPVSIGKLCYRGIPDTDGAAFVFNITGNFSGGESYGFFTRRCRSSSISIPWRRAIHYSFTEGWPNKSQFHGEITAALPELFPEDKQANGEEQNGGKNEGDLPEKGSENKTNSVEESDADDVTLDLQDSIDVDGSNAISGNETGGENASGATDGTNSGENSSPGGNSHGDGDTVDPAFNNTIDVAPDYVSEVIRQSPLKLKLIPIINPSLNNWDPYVEEAVVLAKFKIMKDFEYTGGFNFDTGRVNPSGSMLSLDDHADTMWFKIIKSAALIVKTLFPDELISPDFFDDVVQLFGYLFRNIPDDPDNMNDSAFQIIINALGSCKESAKTIRAMGNGCFQIFDKLEVEGENGEKKYLDLNRLPPHSNSFQSHTNDVVVESVWNFIDLAVCKCYSSFAPDNINEHHRLYVYMKELFRHERIQKRWFSAFKGVNTYFGLLPYGNYKVIMYNFDKLKASVHNDCLHSGWIPKPELSVPKYAATNVIMKSKKRNKLKKNSARNVKVRVNSKESNNDDPFVFGDEEVKYEKPFHRMTNTNVGFPWRVRRDVQQEKEEREQSSIDQLKNQETLATSPEVTILPEMAQYEKYEIWNGMAYCLQANYEENENGKVSMNGIFPSIEDLSPMCSANDY